MLEIGEGSKIYERAKIVDDETHNVKLGKNCTIGDFAFVAPRQLVMADGSQISPNAILSGGGKVFLGINSVVGFGSILITATDSVDAKYMCEAAKPDEREIVRGSISLGEGAYIGSGAVVCISKRCKDIVIGAYSVVGSLCYIDKSVPSHTIIYPKVEHIIKPRRF